MLQFCNKCGSRGTDFGNLWYLFFLFFLLFGYVQTSEKLNKGLLLFNYPFSKISLNYPYCVSPIVEPLRHKCIWSQRTWRMMPVAVLYGLINNRDTTSRQPLLCFAIIATVDPKCLPPTKIFPLPLAYKGEEPHNTWLILCLHSL